MVLPPSWKTEIEKTVEEKTDAHGEREEAQREKDSTSIAREIKALVDACNTQADKPKRTDKVKRRLDVATVVLIFFTALFTGLAWWVFKGQLDEMRTDQRPWVGAPEIEMTFHGSPRGAVFIYTFKNVGHSPTRGLYIDADFVSGREQWYPKANALCERMKKENVSTTVINPFSLIPENKWVVDFSDMPTGKLHPGIDMDSLQKAYPNPYIAGCVIYGSGLDTFIHRTLFGAQVDTKNFSLGPVSAADAD